jgi:hypothetical protein
VKICSFTPTSDKLGSDPSGNKSIATSTPDHNPSIVFISLIRYGSPKCIQISATLGHWKKKHAKYLYNISHISDTYCWLLYV